jgi:hypothetical protein
MTAQDLARLRLINQSIAAPRFAAPEDVVASMVAMQAQDYGQALWAIGLRTKSATKADVERAVAEGKILRTWPMRGTIHFVTPHDAKWMLRLLTPRMVSASKARRVNLGITDAMLARAADLAAEALQGGKRLARPAMLRLFEAAGIPTNDGRGYHILWYLSQQELICIGPLDGKQQTFVLLDEWAPNAVELSREESLGELARRYFTAHGPATVADLTWWTGMTLGDARQGLELAKGDLESVQVDGQDYWLSRHAHDHVDTSGVFLLAGFDEYLLGYKNRSAVMPDGSFVAYVNGVFFPVIVIDGQVVGLWKRVVKNKHVEVSFAPFHSLGAEDTERIHAAAGRYEAFVGAPLVFSAK